MKNIKQGFEILTDVNGEEMLRNIEEIGRVCYKSETAISTNSAKKFVKMLIDHGHESVIEHEKITVKFLTDRGISHEIVRHRVASYSQESTRYCNYTNDKFGNEIKIVLSDELKNDARVINLMKEIEEVYEELIFDGYKPEIARDVLPTCLKTEIVCTYNLREWRHFFKMRCDKSAHPKIRKLVIPLLNEFKRLVPVVFDDLNYSL